jgi:hypothetical protein
MAYRKRRVHDEEPAADRRMLPARERDVGRDGPAGQVLRLQKLAGNRAISGLLRSPDIQRDEAPAPTPTDDKPKESGIPVVVEDSEIGTVVALSVNLLPSRLIGGSEGDEKPARKVREVVITRRMDEKSHAFSRRSIEGRPFPTVVINFPGMPFVMKEVVVSSYSISSGDEPMESITLSGFEPDKKK